MNVVILVPSADYFANAGARIRYVRLSADLAKARIDLALTPIDDFDPRNTDADVAIISKVYDARSLVAAAALSRRGVSVGVDIFDDYFSQDTDTRLSRFRTWLRQVLSLVDFALCSTPVLAEVIGRYQSDIATHVMRDPAIRFEQDQLSDLLARKSRDARSDGVIRAIWFGIGDNPYFPVGIRDVAAFTGSLAALSRAGLPVEFTVLTNRRALDSIGLGLLAKIPLPMVVEEWTEERERDELERAFLCFLPTNAQPFSRAKSLNRVLTALTAGCQVLSAGFPLYAEFDQWIYRAPEDLADDWKRASFRFSPTSVSSFAAKIAETGSAEREAGQLKTFLKEVRTRSRSSRAGDGPIALLHGFGTSPGAHAAVKRASGLSIGSDFCAIPLEFDGVVAIDPQGRTRVSMARRVLARLASKWRSRLSRGRSATNKFVELPESSSLERPESILAPSLPLQLALYERVIEQGASVISDALVTSAMLLSEESSLPLEARLPADV